jgi:GNAT superfamily N-acetyltransferase
MKSIETKYGKGSIENFHNENDSMLVFLVAVDSFNNPVACGALKHFSNGTAEIKRMFVLQEQRGKGLSKKILAELEKISIKLGYKRAVLETGLKQPEAISLYRSNGYIPIKCYGKYAADPESVCFQKTFF